jgi:hypothetical protein
MNFAPVADAGWATYVCVNNGVLACSSLPLIILSEAIVLWRVLPKHFFRRPFWHSLGYSFLMNLVSALLGLVSSPLWSDSLDPAFMKPPEGSEILGSSFDFHNYYTPSPGAVEALWLKLTFVFFVLSMVIEGIVLTLSWGLQSRSKEACPLGTIWLASLIVNLISYTTVFIVYPYFLAPGFFDSIYRHM